MANGIVTWFNGSKGYGFVGQEDGSDVFGCVSETKATGFKTLCDGDRGTFGKEQTKKAFDAAHVTLVVD